MHMNNIQILFLEQLEGNSTLKSCSCNLLAGKKVEIHYLSLVEPCQPGVQFI